MLFSIDLSSMTWGDFALGFVIIAVLIYAAGSAFANLRGDDEHEVQ